MKIGGPYSYIDQGAYRHGQVSRAILLCHGETNDSENPQQGDKPKINPEQGEGEGSHIPNEGSYSYTKSSTRKIQNHSYRNGRSVKAIVGKSHDLDQSGQRSYDDQHDAETKQPATNSLQATIT